MSASPIARQATQSQSIPTKRILLSDPSQLPIDYSSTPGGTLYSTTPGGTRIVYDRSMLLHLRNSPMSQTPPKSGVPDDLMKGHVVKPNVPLNGLKDSSPVKNDALEDEHSQFEMDM